MSISGAAITVQCLGINPGLDADGAISDEIPKRLMMMDMMGLENGFERFDELYDQNLTSTSTTIRQHFVEFLETLQVSNGLRRFESSPNT